MLIKGLKDEDFVNYKKPSMFIIMPFCSFKCDKENGCNLCQNSHLAQEPEMNMPILAIVARYKENPITKAVVCGGLEPFDSADSLANLVHVFRQYTNDDIVIYTGYEEWELLTNPYYEKILEYDNIVIKYGRFRPG
jgi:organic radical activating enzyme